MRHHLNAVLFIQMNDNFSITARPEAMPAMLQLLTQLGKVKNFSVVSDPKSFVFIAHGLMTSWTQVDDAQAVIAQSNGILHARTA